ncbi:MAG: 50S ribosomal protein L11 methyltransferase, partial [Pseudomonadota bacterium]|nr:50S ribosomal protein L11 methyltransferase [Pseudomonadota bacterium]
MPWIQITLDIEAPYVERVSAQLTALGALAVTLQDAADQPLYEPPIQTTPLWQRTRISGLFAGDTDGAQLQAQLQAQLTDIALPSCPIELLPDQDWSRAYLAELKPLQIDQRLWICPSWQ